VDRLVFCTAPTVVMYDGVKPAPPRREDGEQTVMLLEGEEDLFPQAG
jgi:hypothetical protein